MKLTLFGLGLMVCFLYGSCWNQMAPRSTVGKQWGQSVRTWWWRQDTTEEHKMSGSVFNNAVLTHCATLNALTHTQMMQTLDSSSWLEMLGNALKLGSFGPECLRNHVSKSVVISLTGTLCPLPENKQECFKNKIFVLHCQEQTSVPNTILSHHQCMRSWLNWHKLDQWKNQHRSHSLWTQQCCTYCGRMATEAEHGERCRVRQLHVCMGFCGA